MLNSQLLSATLNEATEGLNIIKKVLVYDELQSTNDEALKLEREGTLSGTLVIAQRQTNGRGRLGRSWLMPEGNIACSLLLRAEHLPKYGQTLMSLVPAIAIREALLKLSLPVCFKWPNDIVVKMPEIDWPRPSYFLDHFKLGGILCECSMQNAKLAACVFCIGRNHKFPPHFREQVPHAISIHELLPNMDLVILMRLLMVELDSMFGFCSRPDFAEQISQRYEQHCASIGHSAHVEL